MVDDAYLQVDYYPFNNQTTSSSTVGPVSKACGSPSCIANFTISTSRASYILGIEVWYAAHLPGQSSVSSNHVGYSVPFNNNGAVYPQEQDTRAGSATIVPFPAPPPTFQSCPQIGTIAPPGCSKRSSAFAGGLEEFYKTQGFPLGIFFQHPIEAHHIQPLCWGGNNSFQNGVYLLGSVHRKFTAWWRAITIDGSSSVCSDVD